MSDGGGTTAEEHGVENDSDTENEEDNVSFGKDGDLSSDEAQFLEAEAQVSTQKVEKKKEKCGNKPKVKIKTLTIDGQLVYFCKICDKIFTRRKDKLNHELAHSGETMLTCTECGKEYLHESSLASHMRTHDVDPLFMCDLCPKMFAQSHHLKTHILSHSEPTNFTCKTCYKEFATAIDLSHHNRSLISQEMTQYWCKMCKVYFCRTHGPVCERRIHAYRCSACNELFYTQKKLKIHMRKFAHFSKEKPHYIEPLTEQELYPLKLPEGVKRSQSAKENSILKQSYQNSPREAKRQADEDVENIVPRKKFKLSPRKVFVEDEQSSTSIQDSAPERKYEAGSELRSPSKYRKGKPYCKKCNKSFKDSFELDRHRTSVHDESSNSVISTKQCTGSSVLSFICKICGAGFPSKEDLERHCFKHSGERMHVCPMCGEEFPQAQQLTKHLKTHMGDHPYRCSQCGKSFRLKIQLIQHVRLHIVQDANSCDKCPSKFNTRAELHDHMVQAHRDVLRCHLCRRGFTQRSHLMAHLRLHHRTVELDGIASSTSWSQIGLKRSASAQEVETLSSTGVKAEPWGSDCESEQSFCSSFTRDSERSDVFKFSSDESYSFKTTMAKERVRLRRRWRQNQRKMFDRIASQAIVVKGENEDPATAEGDTVLDVKPECCEDEEEGEDIDPENMMDMNVELNAVHAEGSNVLTVYVNVTHKPPARPVPAEPLSVVTKDESHKICEGFVNPHYETHHNALSEKVGLDFQNLLEGSEIEKHLLKKEMLYESSSGGNLLMFEFDAEELSVTEEDLPKFPPCDEPAVSNVKESDEVLSSNPGPNSENLLDQSIMPKQKTSGVSSVTNTSDLARLQEAFQNSAKYLPLPHRPQASHTGANTDNHGSNFNPPSHTDTNSPAYGPEKVMTPKTCESDFQAAKVQTVHMQSSSSKLSQSAPLTKLADPCFRYQMDSVPCELKPQSVLTKPVTESENSCFVFKSQHQKAGVVQSKKKPKPLAKTSPAQVQVSVSPAQTVNSVTPVAFKPITPRLHTTSTSSRVPSTSSQPSSVSSSLPSSVAYLTTHSQLTPSSRPQSTSWMHGANPTVTAAVPMLTSNVRATPQPSECQARRGEPQPSPNLLPPNQPPVAIPSGVAIQASTIFDTNNPLLRDMNMMDLVRANTPAFPPPPPTPQQPSSATPLPLPNPASILQSFMPPPIVHPVGVSNSSIPSGLPTSLPLQLPQNPSQIFQPSPATAQIPPSMPSYAAINKPTALDLQIMQRTNTIANNSSSNHLMGLGVQDISSFALQQQHHAGFGPDPNFQNPSSMSSGLGQAFNHLQQQQQQQQQLIFGQPDASLLNLGNMLGAGVGGASLPGQGDMNAALAMNAHMRLLQDSALKDSMYLNGVQSSGFPQIPTGMLMGGGMNQMLQPNFGDVVNGGLNANPLNVGVAGPLGAASINFSNLHRNPPLVLEGQFPPPLPQQPPMINVINQAPAPSFAGAMGGLQEPLGHHAPAMLGPNLVNTPVMLSGGPPTVPANLAALLGAGDPGSFLSHFPSFLNM